MGDNYSADVLIIWDFISTELIFTFTIWNCFDTQLRNLSFWKKNKKNKLNAIVRIEH